MKITSFALLILLSISYSSCKVDSSITSPYVSYFKGDNTFLYFIKPLTMIGEMNKAKVQIDFTFNDQKDSDSSFVTVNYTVYSLDIKGGIKASFEQKNKSIELLKNEMIFQEGYAGNTKIRYSGQLSKVSFLGLLKDADFKLKLVSQKKTEEQYSFVLKNKYRKKLYKTSVQLYENLAQKIIQ